MPVRRGDKWEGRLKIGGRVIRTQRFDTKRVATEWERKQRAAFYEKGLDPSAGRVSVESLLSHWLEDRESRVSETTLKTDRFLIPTAGQRAGTSRSEPVLPVWLRKLHVSKVTPSVIQNWQDDLSKRDLVPTTVLRYRQSLSSFFSWCVSEGYIAQNPVFSTSPPKDRRVRNDMRPLSTPEFDQVLDAVSRINPVLGNLVLVLGRTGLRWGELRAMQVEDFTETPMPMLHVIRNQPEGSPVKTPKSGKSRNLPLPNYLVPTIRQFADGKEPEDLLFTSPQGAQLHRSPFVRATNWFTTGQGRTLHDLRHTAACEWLIKGVPLTTVQAWLGHGSIQMTARYLHHLGDFADRAALEVLNNTAPEPPTPQVSSRLERSERARKLPDVSAFGVGPIGPQSPVQTRGLGR